MTEGKSKLPNAGLEEAILKWSGQGRVWEHAPPEIFLKCML